MNKYVDALKDLNKALELEPNVAMTLLNHGVVKRVMKTHANAL